MAQTNRSDTVLLFVTKDGIVKIGLPPKQELDDFPARAATLGKLENVSHVICSPEGELFCVRGRDLYRGPMPSKEGVDWFSIARKVGKGEWSYFKILCFHPNGELYGITSFGEFFKGPQPDNKNIPWIYEQATKIGVNGWNHCEALLFDPYGNLYAVTKDDNIVKGKPPTTTQEYWGWMKTITGVGGSDWLGLTHFMSFTSDGKLWAIKKDNGNVYRGFIPPDGQYIANAQRMGWGYHEFPFFSFTKDKTVSNVLSFEFLPDQGTRLSETPEVIEQKIYDNRKSSNPLKHTFTFDKTVKQSSSFSHEHGFTFAVGTEIKFKAGVPFFAEVETAVKIDASTTHTWSFTNTNETEVKFSTSSEVEVPPGKAIRVVASVVKAQLNVPYRAKVRTLFGFEAETEGTWNGASVYNLMVKQEDYNK